MLFYPSSIFWKPLRVLLFLLLFYSSSFESCLRGNMIIHPSILSHFSCVQLSATLWTKACQASLSMGFSMQEYWSGLPCSPPGDLPNPGIEPRSPTLQADSLPSEPPGRPFELHSTITFTKIILLDPHKSPRR